MIDAINQNTHAFISANSKSKPKPPTPVERPDARQKRKNSPNSFAAMAAKHVQAVRNKRGDDGGRSRG